MSDQESENFWECKDLDEMSPAEWESLCDGCARCCMVKLEDEETDNVDYTAVVCHLLDDHSCRCTRYLERHALVPDCVQLTPDNVLDFKWLPVSCAYRRIAEGRPLEPWHPLISKKPDSVHEAQISVQDKVVSELSVHENQLEDMIIKWVEY